MSWVSFNDTIFKFEEVRHFGISGTDEKSNILMYLRLEDDSRASKGQGLYPKMSLLAQGTQKECEQWIKEIIAGEHNLPCQEDPIRASLIEISRHLERICEQIEIFVLKSVVILREYVSR